jgi:GH24 family phage-related lysozyme (muramidase)
MNPEARATFLDLMTQMGEGNTDYGYPDQLGNITIGRGNLIPNLAMWMRLDWRNSDNSLASNNAVQTAWTLLQQQSIHVMAAGPDRWPGGGAFAWVTHIRATQACLDALAYAKLDAIDAKLAATWPGYAEAPPPAQQALARIAWACGTEPPKGCCQQGWPKLYAFWCAKDWATFDADGNPVSGCITECDLPSVRKTEPEALGLERDLFRQAAVINSA